MDLALWVYPVLFLTGFAAGLVDAVAGGGGIITLPVLLNLGLPVSVALGTNKLQASFGSVTAAWHYTRRGLVDLRACGRGILATLVGALLGAWVVRSIDGQVLGRLIPWLLAAIVTYMIFRPHVGGEDRPARMGEGKFALLFGLGLGFYDGFFGPGTGSFWTIAFVALLGHDFVRAAAHTKAMNLASNAAALVVFAAHGAVLLLPGLALGAGNLLGARLGAHLALTRGARFVRPLFLLMASLVAVKLLYAHLHP